MELLVPTPRISPLPTLFSFHPNSNLFSITDFSLRTKPFRRPNLTRHPHRVSLKSDQNAPSKDYVYRDDGEVLWGEDSNTVEVIGIGSRKDAILDFCLDSPFQTSFSSLRFWTIILNDSSAVQLQQKSIGKDIVLRNMEFPTSQLTAPRTVILVASAGYGLDHITAIELLGAVKSANGLAVGIVLKPFSFEGQRRREEIMELVTKLRGHTNFCVVVDTDALLKKEVLTLAEALKSANNAVLLSINSIFVLMSETHKKYFDDPLNIKKELDVLELLKLVESSSEARVGFGAGHNMRSSIARAVFDCPFIADGVKELNGVVICTLACAVILENSNLDSFVHIFRQTTGWQKEIVLSIVHEPNLEQNLFVTTIIVCGSTRENVSERTGFLSSLAQRFPFVFSLLGRGRPASKESLPDHLVESHSSIEGRSSLSSGELQTLSGSAYDENSALGDDKRIDVESSSASDSLISDVYDHTSEGKPPFEREPLIWWNVGPSFHIAKEWAKERASIFGSNPVLNNQSIYTLPVGVKPSEKSQDSTVFSNMQSARSRISNDINKGSPESQNTPSWDALTDSGLEAVMDIFSATPTILKRTDPNASKKPGLLSMRAASMLEVERESEKKWDPIIEMRYQGGMYKGRCQGGLPEGKGRLTLVDGSVYDGTWRCGKKSGVGTFYYSNGDVFQGSWRDDLMHGKGWFYFHSGDRWYANFWKGKANGEGRFYSKDGEIFFGQFQDGWRHGSSLCISADGIRWDEVWDEGVLLSRQQM